ncbi:MAG: polyisoprenoid-binding protein [Sulfobacillus acidophilus]|uniref:Polyisoprenoid-binding protein n=1 Tax=Sulfobacillus acidophilus TaxID=53633 RepID=A0A2T2WHK5_9FIRM|nr:MAG: polyisoprenoid-binding protein [Sulfobacillus acidophilus]
MAENQDVWVIDAAHSTAGFVVRHLVSKVRGHFQDFEGRIIGNPEDLSTAHAEFSAQVASVNTNQPDRDKHLRTSDFFDVEHYPTMTYQSNRIEKTGDGTYTVYGTLTLRGVSKEVPVKVEYLGTSPDPWGHVRAGFECSARINRKDFGVNWNQVLEAGGMMVGDNVDINLELETVKQ